MKPVVVFRHAKCEGAGYFGTFLEHRDIPWCEVRIDLGDALPSTAKDFSGVVLMGGAMSVNDDLPWIDPTLNLIQQAIQEDVPVLGHCLGGQLISKALGAKVIENQCQEIGWGHVQVANNNEAKRWFGNTEEFLSFHWHGETFTLPEGATRLLSSKYCLNQAYSFGKHFAMQCHVEMTEEMVHMWCSTWHDEMQDALDSPGVQTVDEMCKDLRIKVAELNKYSEKIYSEWVKGLKV